jgi:hypothetical protein
LVMSSSVAKPLATLTLLVVMAEHELDLDDRVTACGRSTARPGRRPRPCATCSATPPGCTASRRRRPHSSRTTLLRWWT